MTGKKAKTAPTVDTKDESAKAFVESGVNATDVVKDKYAAGSGRGEEKQDAIDAAARDNLREKDGAESNHNSMTPTNPVNVDQADRPDYNPQRRPSSKANQQSALAEGPQEMAERVDAKKLNPTNAEITQERTNEVTEAGVQLNPGESAFKGET